MAKSLSVQEQVSASGGDRPRVLIGGAGVAGATLAALLRRRGLHPVVVERSGPGGDSGYMISLMPLVDRAIDELGIRDEYVARTIPLDRYALRRSNGAISREYSLAALLSAYGDNRGISRGDLIDLLAGDSGVSYRTTVSAIEQPDSGPVRVTVRTDGEAHAEPAYSEVEFDAVVVADGQHSGTRKLLSPRPRVGRVDTGWGGWVAWVGPRPGEEDLGEELWGDGAFIGRYPVQGRVGVIVAGPHTATAVGAPAFADAVRRRLAHVDERLDAALTAVAEADDPYYWPLEDRRADAWTSGRVVLLGDSAVGFLPTAGIGACMSMESAWRLAARLGTAGADDVAARLWDFERVQRPRVEAAQNNSRQLARIMFHQSRPLAALRDVASGVVPLQLALRPIRRLLRTAPATP